ncbi:uncharacterized protein [Linepithema humile]|uniref:uncharacterized protein n=1 Tax=Linepithema humile TaxID=83485 RepID=UPI00351E8E42
MDMDKKNGHSVPSQGIRTPRDRRSGSPVPAPAASSSSDGLTVGCSPSSAVNNVIGSAFALFEHAVVLTTTHPGKCLDTVSSLCKAYCFITDNLKCGKSDCRCDSKRAWDLLRSKNLIEGGSTLHTTRVELADSFRELWYTFDSVLEAGKYKDTYLHLCVVLAASVELLGLDLKQKGYIIKALDYLKDMGRPYEFGKLGRDSPQKADHTPIRIRGGGGSSGSERKTRSKATSIRNRIEDTDSSDSDPKPRITSVERLAPDTVRVGKKPAPEKGKKKEEKDAESAMEVVEVADSSGEEDDTTRPPSRAGDPDWGFEDSGEEAGPSRPASRISTVEQPEGLFRLPLLHRAQGRPRKDGTGPFKALSTSGSEKEGKKKTRKQGKNLPYTEDDEEAAGTSLMMVRPPPLTGDQRGKVEHRLRQIERGSSREVVVHADKCLDEIENARAASSNMKGSLSGQIKTNVYLLREVLRTLCTRADKVGDPGYWRSQVNTLTSDNTAYRAQNESLLRKLAKSEDAVRFLKGKLAQNPNTEGPLIRDPRSPTLGRDPMGRSDLGSGTEAVPATMIGSTLDLESDAEVFRQTSDVGGAGVRVLKEVSNTLVTLTETLKRMEDRIAHLELGGRTVPTPVQPGPEGRKKKKKGKRGSGAAPPRISLPSHEAGVISEGDLPTGVPVPPSREAEAPWTTVVKGGKGKKGKGPRGPPLPPPPPTKERVTQETKPKKGGPSYAKARKRLPRTAAVAINTAAGSYADVIRTAKDKIDLKDINIKSLTMRKARNGGVLLEISGEQSRMKADALASRMREAVKDLPGEVKISRPSRRMDVRLVGLEIAITPEEIAATIATEGGCQVDEVRMGGVQTTGRRGLNLVWAQCPADAALKLAERGSVNIGWTSVKVELLRSRPAQCFRCLGRGHIQQQCPSNVVRARCCYRCGEEGHNAGSCRKSPHCPICALNGRPSGHRTGSENCPPIPPKREVRSGIAATSGDSGEKPTQPPPRAPLFTSDIEVERETVSSGEAKRPREDSISPPQAELKKARGREPVGSPQPGPSSGP